MTTEEAKQAGYAVCAASAFEVGLTKSGRGVCTWWANSFEGHMPSLDHPIIQKAIETNEELIKEFGEQ